MPRFQFSLRTVFILVTVAAVLAAVSLPFWGRVIHIGQEQKNWRDVIKDQSGQATNSAPQETAAP